MSFANVPQWTRHIIVNGHACARCQREFLFGEGPIVCTRGEVTFFGDRPNAEDCRAVLQ